MAQNFSNSDGAMTTTLLGRGKEGGTAEMEEDRSRVSASCQKVDEAGEGVKSLGSPIRGGAPYSLLKMTRAQARGPRGRVVGE